ncbi:hypothetical protein CALCODRAFT_445092 [Calocera cornea HHB12733]|uniref:Uncharacterized protein n=1 Tax=Calocera cornea HHB12733 TaxID=1353952 RepID=A0A166MQA4_9BASI|nr:hypothetical protein CALCODRAFT_445092 [Calocera cornea HHB12733]
MKDSEEGLNNTFGGFNNAAEWELAHFLKTSRMTKGDINRFLKLIYVKERPLSFENVAQLERKLSAVPGGPKWQQATISIKNAPDQPRQLLYRDPVECLQYLLGNPTFKEDLILEPYFEYTDETMSERLINEMPTGDYCCRVQVRAIIGKDGQFAEMECTEYIAGYRHLHSPDSRL